MNQNEALIIGAILATFIGAIIGLLGAGGSILIMPVLVYILGIPAQTAATYSLGIVGIAAGFSSLASINNKSIALKGALLFSLPAMVSVLLMRTLIVPSLPKQLTLFSNIISLDMISMMLFGIMMGISGISMLRKKNEISQKNSSSFIVSVLGVITGLLTGFIGIGGGFIIVPILTHFAHITMRQAIGTSLLIIAMNSLPGFIADIISMENPDLPLFATLTIAAVLGSLLGSTLSRNVSQDILKKVFAYFMLIMGLLILLKETT